MRWSEAASLLLLLAAGCGNDVVASAADGGSDASYAPPPQRPDAAPGATDAGAPAAILGVGDDVWQAVATDEVVLLHMGPQGGMHIVGHARVENMWPGADTDDRSDAPNTMFQVVDEEGETWSAVRPPIDDLYVPSDAGGHELPHGQFIFMESGAAVLDGQRVEIRVEVDDAVGATGTDARWVVLDLVEG